MWVVRVVKHIAGKLVLSVFVLQDRHNLGDPVACLAYISGVIAIVPMVQTHTATCNSAGLHYPSLHAIRPDYRAYNSSYGAQTTGLKPILFAHQLLLASNMAR